MIETGEAVPTLPKNPQLRDLLVALAVCAAVGGIAVATASLIGDANEPSVAAFATLVLAIAALAASLTLVAALLLARPYELSRPFSPTWLLSIAALDLALAASLLSDGAAAFLAALLAAAFLAGLSRSLRDMRRVCTFCAAPWRHRFHLVGGDGFTVCDRCLDQASTEPEPPLDPTSPRLRCSACPASLPATRYPLRSSTAALCRSCVTLAHEVLARGREAAQGERLR